jgi:hypothetical protein
LKLRVLMFCYNYRLFRHWTKYADHERVYPLPELYPYEF